MFQIGEAPYLECSTKGDKRFSAFYARIRGRGNQSIETLYQRSKIFEDGKTNLSWKEAKGKKPINIEDCRKFYHQLWREYLLENTHLIAALTHATGLRDVFGQSGHACQAEELWKLRNEYSEKGSLDVT